MKIGVVVPVLSNFFGLAEALESIVTVHTWTPYIQPNWRNNYCLSRAWNEGIEQAIDKKSDYILVVNDDVIFSPQAIDELVKLFSNVDEDVVMITGMNVHSAVSPDMIRTYSDGFEYVDEHPDFSCFMISPKGYETIGTFDENFIPAYFEDNDYHRRIKLLNKKALKTTLAPFFHYGSVTSNQRPIPGDVFIGNKKYYIAKWGGEIDRETFDTPFNKGGSPAEWKSEWRTW